MAQFAPKKADKGFTTLRIPTPQCPPSESPTLEAGNFTTKAKVEYTIWKKIKILEEFLREIFPHLGRLKVA